MTAEQVYQTNQEWLDDHENAQGWANEEQLIQQQREGRKMAYEPQDNRIGLFKNDYRKKDGDPIMTGKGLVGGIEYEIAAWKNVSQKTGVEYLGLKFQLPKDKGSSYSKPQPKPEPDEDFPF